MEAITSKRMLQSVDSMTEARNQAEYHGILEFVFKPHNQRSEFKSFLLQPTFLFLLQILSDDGGPGSFA
jgi:hypothetical protein